MELDVGRGIAQAVADDTTGQGAGTEETLDAQSAKAQALALLKRGGFGEEALKKLEAVEVPKIRETDVGKARAQFVAQEQALSKQRTALSAELEELRKAVQAKEEEMAAVMTQLDDAKAGRKHLDALESASSGEAMATHMQQRQLHVQQVSGTFERLRQLMLEEDWEAGAKNNEAAYKQYEEEQKAAGRSVAPIGKWYVTQIMMAAMCTNLLPSPATAAAQVPGAQPAKRRAVEQATGKDGEHSPVPADDIP